jgi:hypothetical protein
VALRDRGGEKASIAVKVGQNLNVGQSPRFMGGREVGDNRNTSIGVGQRVVITSIARQSGL